jgi:deoxycytidine triphosphate deaminase
MILIESEIVERKLVDNPQAAGSRPSTYDATVGEILIEGKSIIDNSFVLHPRGIVWVISKEKFCLPDDVTGLATLKTSWTHDGILALNLGVIDPGWNGHLATAVVNFSKSDYEITKGAAFFRVLFLTHKNTNQAPHGLSSDAYIQKIKTNTRLFSDTFLTMDSLVREIAERVLGFPRLVVQLALGAIVIATLAIMVPMAYTMISQNYVMPARVEALEQLPSRIEKLENEVNTLEEISSSSKESAISPVQQDSPSLQKSQSQTGKTPPH